MPCHAQPRPAKPAELKHCSSHNTSLKVSILCVCERGIRVQKTHIVTLKQQKLARTLLLRTHDRALIGNYYDCYNLTENGRNGLTVNYLE
jgi:hypothetical protein